MGKVFRFKNMMIVIPIKEDETADEVEDRIIDAIYATGARFMSYNYTIEDEPDE